MSKDLIYEQSGRLSIVSPSWLLYMMLPVAIIIDHFVHGFDPLRSPVSFRYTHIMSIVYRPSIKSYKVTNNVKMFFVYHFYFIINTTSTLLINTDNE